MACADDAFDGSANFAKLCCLVVDICRDVLWDILVSYIKPCELQNSVFSNLKNLKLHPGQIYKLRSLPEGSLMTSDFFDVSGLYKILRTVCQELPPPTRGWGQMPLAADLTIADDIERINQLRNRIYGHTTTSYVTETDFEFYWKDIRRVVGRIDGEFDKENLFKMRRLKTKFLDVETAKCLKEQLENVMSYDKDTREMVTGLEERLAALERSVRKEKDYADNKNGDSEGSKENSFGSSFEVSGEDNWPELPTEIRMIVLGKTGTGKSSFANTVLGRHSFSDFCSFKSITVRAELSSCKRFGKKLVVCDTPGLFDTRFDNNFTRGEVSWCMVLSQPGPHVFLIVVRCDARFSQEECDVINTLESHFGNDMYKYTIVVFTHKDHLERVGGKEDDILKTLPKRLQELLRNVNNRYLFVDNMQPYSMNEQIVRKLLDIICEIYNSNEPKVYKNPDLLKCTLRDRFEYHPDEEQTWFQYLKCSVM